MVHTTRAATPALNFTGFPEAGLQFLRALAANNDAIWFKPRREEYEATVRGPMIALLADVLSLAAARKLPLAGDPAKAIFRINRDVRFSRDKRPYKTHCGASLTRTGKRLAPGLFYIHIEPGACFTGAGFWHPEPADLDRLRQRILVWPERFLEIVQAMDSSGMPIEPDEDAAKRLPRGYEAGKGSDVEPFLKHRNLIARCPLRDADVRDPKLPLLLLDRYQAALPLLEFGTAAVDG